MLKIAFGTLMFFCYILPFFLRCEKRKKIKLVCGGDEDLLILLGELYKTKSLKDLTEDGI